MQTNTLALLEKTSDNSNNSLKSLLCHPEYSSNNGELMVPLGISKDGQLLSADIGKISHILIGGTTGSGKTAFIQSLITALAIQYNPDLCKFIIFDSKKWIIHYLTDYQIFFFLS